MEEATAMMSAVTTKEDAPQPEAVVSAATDTGAVVAAAAECVPEQVSAEMHAPQPPTEETVPSLTKQVTDIVHGAVQHPIAAETEIVASAIIADVSNTQAQTQECVPQTATTVEKEEEVATVEQPETAAQPETVVEPESDAQPETATQPETVAQPEIVAQPESDSLVTATVIEPMAVVSTETAPSAVEDVAVASAIVSTEPVVEASAVDVDTEMKPMETVQQSTDAPIVVASDAPDAAEITQTPIAEEITDSTATAELSAAQLTTAPETGDVKMSETADVSMTDASLISDATAVQPNAESETGYDTRSSRRRKSTSQEQATATKDKSPPKSSQKAASPLRLCDEELAECVKLTEWFLNRPNSDAFREPVDWLALGLPNYPQMVKRPMDLGTVLAKLKAGSYPNAQAYAREMRLIWKNCKAFNRSGTALFDTAVNLSHQFDRHFGRIQTEADRKKRLTLLGLDKTKVMAEARLRHLVGLIQSVDSATRGRVVEILEKRCPWVLDSVGTDDCAKEVDIDLYNIPHCVGEEVVTFCDAFLKRREQEQIAARLKAEADAAAEKKRLEEAVAKAAADKQAAADKKAAEELAAKQKEEAETRAAAVAAEAAAKAAEAQTAAAEAHEPEAVVETTEVQMADTQMADTQMIDAQMTETQMTETQTETEAATAPVTTTTEEVVAVETSENMSWALEQVPVPEVTGAVQREEEVVEAVAEQREEAVVAPAEVGTDCVPQPSTTVPETVVSVAADVEMSGGNADAQMTATGDEAKSSEVTAADAAAEEQALDRRAEELKEFGRKEKPPHSDSTMTEAGSSVRTFDKLSADSPSNSNSAAAENADMKAAADADGDVEMGG